MEQRPYPIASLIGILLFIFVIVVFLFYLYVTYKDTSGEIKHYVLFENGVTAEVEIADNFKDRQNGLMNRESLGETNGMLFIFDDESFRKFWMKNTKIPLDMIYLDSEKRIGSIIENVPPCLRDPCELYDSGIKSKYVIEVNAGFCKKNDIKLNTTVKFETYRSSIFKK